MAKKEVSTEPTTTGSFIRCFAMVYFSLVTTTHETPDESKAAAAEEYGRPDSIAVPIITTETPAPPAQEVLQAANNNGNLQPAVGNVQDRELGKAVIGIPVAILAMAIMLAGKGELGEPGLTLILVLVCFSFAAITSSMGLRDKYVEFAKTVEQLGVVLVAISFCAVVAFFLPPWALWVPAVSIGCILVSFAIQVRQPAAPT